ncbi:MAG: DNA-3-methyladenine glycosylase [Acidimicrobiales bacterium]
MTSILVDRNYFRRPPEVLAPALLNKLLVSGDQVGRIVEVEAYGGFDDQASHGWRGPRRANLAMFGPPGHLYVYLCYGIHHCVNVVCQPAGEAAAVLIRGLTPLSGLDGMRARRPGVARERDLCSGPGRLAVAMGLNRSHDGLDLTASDRVWLADDGLDPPAVVPRTARIGVSTATDRLWRFHVPGAAGLSRPG